MWIARHGCPDSEHGMLSRNRWPAHLCFLLLAGALISLQGCVNDQSTESSSIPDTPSLSSTAATIHDDFTDVDSTLLQNHVPDGGSVPFSWFRSTVWNGTAVIEGNAVTAESLDWAYVTSIGTGDRAEFVVEVPRSLAPGEVQDVAIYLRTQNADVAGGDGVGALWSLLSDGSFVTVQNEIIQSTGPVSAGLHTFAAEINGSGEVEVRIDSALVGSVPVVNLPLPARTGIGSTGTPVARLTSFSASSRPPLDVQVVCLPESPVRGTEVACTASLPSGATVSKWTFSGLDVSSSVVEHTTSSVWRGVAAFGGTVLVEATVDGVATSASASFTVTPRDWSQMTAVHLAQEVPAYELPIQPTREADLRVTRSSTVGFVPSDRIAQVASGPNQGWYYATQVPIKDSSEIQINRVALTKNSDFYRRHRGRGQGDFCAPSEVLAYLPKAIEHEGVNLEENSHSWSYGHGLDQTVGTLVEGVVGPTPEDLAASARDAAGPAIDAATAASEQVDILYPIEPNGCRFNYF